MAWQVKLFTMQACPMSAVTQNRPKGGMRRPTPWSCPLTPHACSHMYTSCIHIYIHKIKNLNIKKNKSSRVIPPYPWDCLVARALWILKPTDAQVPSLKWPNICSKSLRSPIICRFLITLDTILALCK